MKPSIGQIAYDAYKNSTGGVSLASGVRLGEYVNLDDKFKIAWTDAAQAVLDNYEHEKSLHPTVSEVKK